MAMKWGMTGKLPIDHLYNTNGGWSLAKGIQENSLLSNIKGIGDTEEASHSTSLSSGDQWHHIVSTYDGGTRKIFLDGTEVSSASASGSVASSTAALLLGATDLDSNTDTISAANHSGIKLDEVRFYSSGLTSSQVSALYNFGKGDIGNIGDFATLPSKISGTKGTALSTTVTAAFPNAYYEAVNLTPGLSINASTGEISGTPTVGGVGSITVIAKNAAGKRAVTTIPYDSNPTGPAFSFPTLSPGSDHAIILSEITHSGGEENTVDLVWSTNATLLDTQFPDLGTLSSGTNYYYQGMLPSSFPSLKIWLAADDNTTLYSDTSLTTQATGTVAGWADKSGNDRHLLSQGDPTTGSRTHNGKNVIDFDGNDYFETSASYDSGDDFSFLMVAGIDSINNPNDSILTIRQTIGNPTFQIEAQSSSAFKVRFFQDGMGTDKTFASSAQHGPSIYEFIFNGTTNLFEVFLDGTSLDTTAYTSAPHSGNKLNIFSNRAQNQMPDGFVAEIIGFSTALSNDERQDAESYLAHKWGITLPNSHPHKTNPALGWSSAFQASLPVYASAINTGSGKEGFYGTTITGLTAGETYHYRTRSTGKQNPKSISSNDLKLWLDASDTASIEMDSSNNVLKWHDKSGNGYDAFGSVNNQLPLYSSTGINSKPALSFDGSNDFLEANTRLGLPANPAITVLMVARINQFVSTNDVLFSIGSAARSLSISSGIDGWAWRFDGGNECYGNTTKNTNYLLVWERPANGNFASSKFYLNGIEQARTSGSSDSSSPTDTSNFYTVGVTKSSGGGYFNGRIGELIVLNSDSNTERQKTEGYLAHKWGLVGSLSGSHAYRFAPPVSNTTWSTRQTFTTPTNVTPPVLGSLSVANLEKTTADIEGTLSDNGNAATSLVFYWGDNDGGTNPASWDSNITISNAQEGTLRKSLSGLIGGTTYYFRTFASNWSGNTWATTTRSFTTITSTTRDTPVRDSDLTGWWRLDGSFKDSSGNNHHGDATFVFNPENLNNLQFWLDAKESSSITKDSSNRVQQWKDRRGTSLNVSQSTDEQEAYLQC
jgi:hypothetical protein